MQADLRLAVPTLIGVTAGVIGLLAVTLHAGEKEAVNWSPLTIMIVAALLRFLFLLRQPELSDDIYRYLWDGLQSLMGHKPYALAPADSQLQSETLARLFENVNHPHLVTIYPPAAQLIFMAGSALGAGVFGLKCLMMGMDLAMCAIILRLLHAVGLPSWRGVLYAWHPLPILEIAASGHIDGAGVLFLFLTLLVAVPALEHSKEPFITGSLSLTRVLSRGAFFLLAGLTFACAALVKLVPLIFLPGCLILFPTRGKGLFIIGLLTGATLLTLPFLPDVQKALVTLAVYAQRWEFASFAYRTLHRVTSSGNIARWTLALAFLFTIAFSYCRFSLKQRQSRCHGVSLEGPFLLLQVFYTIALAYLLLTPTLHPWYALYLVCLLPFAAGPAGLTLSWSVFLAYRVLMPYAVLGQWVEDDSTPFMIWLAPVAAFLLSAIAGALTRRNPV